MKILEWMHHKFRHNSIKPFKDLSIGNSCIRLSAQASLDDQDLYSKPNFGPVDGFSSKQPKQDEENYFSLFEEKKYEEPSATISEIFHGFLTIGTLGSDASINEPGTPTFATTLENITDGIIQVTENDLKLINYELEKFLEAEGKGGESEESSARNSSVSITTLGGKQMERAEDEDYWKTLVCPLQGYLLGSSTEPPEARTELKKEMAPTLGGKIQKTRVSTQKCTESEQTPDKNKQKSAMHFMKKIIKKVHPSPHSASGKGPDVISTKKELSCQTDSASKKKKFPKVMRIFHRKIHPESSTVERESVSPRNCMAKETFKGGNNQNLTDIGGENRRFPQTSMEGSWCKMNKMNPPQQSSLSCYNFREKGEHWINIDDDYLVLELHQQKL